MHAIRICAAAAAGSALLSPAAAQDLQVPVSAYREALVDTFLIDSVWDDAYLETLSETTDQLGPFEQDLFSDQVGTYQHCDARVVHESDLFDAGAWLETEARANGLNFDFVNVPVRSETHSSLGFAFDLPGPRRFRLDVELEIERTALVGRAEGAVTLAGPAGTIFTLAAADGASEQEQIVGWLETGRHALDADIRAEVDASTDGDPYGDPETSFAWAFVFFELYAPADVNRDGRVDVGDLVAVIATWGPCPAPAFPCDADIDRDGHVGVDDLIAVIAGWGA